MLKLKRVLKLGKKGQEDHNINHHHATLEITAIAMGLTIIMALFLIIYIMVNYVRSR